MLDTVALYGNGLGRARVGGPLDAALGAISVGSIAFILVTIAVVAVARRRAGLALTSAISVVGACATSYLLKPAIGRPYLGVDPDRAYAGNSLPSGHATAAAAFAIGLTLVAPPRARGVLGVLGAAYAAVVGVATLSSGWHRPSDVIAGYLVAGGWAALAGLVLVAVQRPTAVVTRQERAHWSLAGSLAIGSFLTVMGLAAMFSIFERMRMPLELMGHSILRLGYVGAVLLVTGAAFLMMASVLVSLHRVVPHDPTGTEPPS
jgi:membrane-associated phospholipid phosphatase